MAARHATLNQDFEVAARAYELLYEIDTAAGETSSGGYSLLRLADIQAEQGKYRLAEQNLLKGQSVVNFHGLYGSRLVSICELARAQYQQGKFDIAGRTLEEVLLNCNDPPSNEYVSPVVGVNSIYPYLNEFNTCIGDYDAALEFSLKRLTYLRGRATPEDVVSDALNQDGCVYYFMGDDEKAEEMFMEAAGNKGRAIIAFPNVQAESYKMLGKISSRRGNYTEALSLLRRAIDILRPFSQQPGRWRTEKADIYLLIGNVQLKMGNSIDAKKSFQESMLLRNDTTTQTHPNAADAHKGLADAAASENHFTTASIHLAMALQIYDEALVPTHPRIAPTLVASWSLARIENNQNADEWWSRIVSILSGELGPWKEDTQESAIFYQSVLRDAGRAVEADQLETIMVEIGLR